MSSSSAREVNVGSDFKSFNRFIGRESKIDGRVEVTKEKNRMYLSTPQEISLLIRMLLAQQASL